MLPGLLSPPPPSTVVLSGGGPTGALLAALVANEERSAASPEVSGSVAVPETSWVVFMSSIQPELKNPGRQTDTKGQ